ncbi:hypothetical protein BaRGS_00037060, partial [Batillaria attramentaria]
ASNQPRGFEAQGKIIKTKNLCKQLSTSVVLYVSTPSCKVAFGPYGVDTRYNLQGKPVYYDPLEGRI